MAYMDQNEYEEQLRLQAEQEAAVPTLPPIDFTQNPAEIVVDLEDRQLYYSLSAVVYAPGAVPAGFENAPNVARDPATSSGAVPAVVAPVVAPPAAAPPAPAAPAAVQQGAGPIRRRRIAAPAPPHAPAAAGAQWRPTHTTINTNTDGFLCPGLANDCMHMVSSQGGYRDHIKKAHGFDTTQLNDPNNAGVRAIFLPARRRSWFEAQGIDTTYQGTEKKQIAARARIARGMDVNDPDYLREVYKGKQAVADV